MTIESRKEFRDKLFEIRFKQQVPGAIKDENEMLKLKEDLKQLKREYAQYLVSQKEAELNQEKGESRNVKH